MERKDELEARVRETPLSERLSDCRKRIGKMCSEGRPPRMCIPVQWDDDDFYISTTLVDAQRALDAEREKVAAYDRWLSGGVYFTTQEYDDHIAHHNQQLATLQAQLVAEQQRADRAVKDRSDVLYVKTKEGLSCSEWLMRTAIAERKVKDLEAQLRQVEGEVTALRAENARLREALAKVCLELECSADPIYIQMGSWLRGRLAQAALQPEGRKP